MELALLRERWGARRRLGADPLGIRLPGPVEGASRSRRAGGALRLRGTLAAGRRRARRRRFAQRERRRPRVRRESGAARRQSGTLGGVGRRARSRRARHLRRRRVRRDGHRGSRRRPLSVGDVAKVPGPPSGGRSGSGLTVLAGRPMDAVAGDGAQQTHLLPRGCGGGRLQPAGPRRLVGRGGRGAPGEMGSGVAPAQRERRLGKRRPRRTGRAMARRRSRWARGGATVSPFGTAPGQAPQSLRGRFVVLTAS